MTELELYINSYFGIKNPSLSKIITLFKPTNLNKNDFLCQLNKRCDSLCFIKSGALRVFINLENKEITQWICSKGEFATDLSSLIFDTPARWNIQALTDCELYTIKKEDYLKIGTYVPEWHELEKLFLSKCFLMLEDRVFSFLSMSAEQRYNSFIAHKKELFNEVPHHYIASMLGLSPETLSRVRSL